MMSSTSMSNELPVVDRTTIDASNPTREGPVAGVLLAAGTSSRFGSANKLLAMIDGEPLVRRSARTLVDARTDPSIVVVGYEGDRVREALSNLNLEFVENNRYEAGQATSVVAATRELADRPVDAVVFALGDMPFVERETVTALIDAYRADVGDAIAPAYEGRRGNPVLFDARYFGDLTGLAGDTGGRGVLLGAENACLLNVDDPGVLRDVDHKGDLPSGR